MPEQTIRQITAPSCRPDLDIGFTLNTIWTVTTAINISCSSKASILVEEYDENFLKNGGRLDQIPDTDPEYLFILNRARKSLFHPLEGLVETLDDWSSQIRKWASRATYMQSTTELSLRRKHRRHRERHPGTPSPTNKTIALCREALRNNGVLDFQYIQSFGTWTRKLHGEYDASDVHPRDDTEVFLLPELKLLESLLQSICEAYRDYDGPDSQESVLSISSSALESSYSPTATAVMRVSSSPDASNIQEPAARPPSTPLKFATKNTQNTSQTAHNDKPDIQTSQTRTTSSSSSLTLSPPPATSPAPTTTTIRDIHPLPDGFHPSKHPLDGPIYFHALHLVNNALGRLEKLLEELEAYSELAEDMAEVYVFWHEKVERWTRERERRETEWREKCRERMGVRGGDGYGHF